MSLSYVLMQPPAGTTPTVLHMPDGTVLFPVAANNWQVSVAPSFVTTLLSAGWSVVIGSGQTHVP